MTVLKDAYSIAHLVKEPEKRGKLAQHRWCSSLPTDAMAIARAKESHYSSGAGRTGGRR